MRILVDSIWPHEKFNEAVRNGTAGDTIERIIAEQKPEAFYFTERDGKRGFTMIVNIEKASDIPSISEPWFLSFNADCHFRIMMTPEDLGNAGLDEIGKKWG